MTIDQLLRAKRNMERIVASAVYEFELATEFAARVHHITINHVKPSGTNGEIVLATSEVLLPDRISAG